MQAPIPPSGSHLWQSIVLVSPNSFFPLATALDRSRLFFFWFDDRCRYLLALAPVRASGLRLSKPHLRLYKHFLECPQSRGTFFLYSIRACRFLLPVGFIARENTEYPVPRSFFASQPTRFTLSSCQSPADFKRGTDGPGDESDKDGGDGGQKCEPPLDNEKPFT